MKKPMSAVRALALRFCGSRRAHAAHEWSGCRCPGLGRTR